MLSGEVVVTCRSLLAGLCESFGHKACSEISQLLSVSTFSDVAGSGASSEYIIINLFSIVYVLHP